MTIVATKNISMLRTHKNALQYLHWQSPKFSVNIVLQIIYPPLKSQKCLIYCGRNQTIKCKFHFNLGASDCTRHFTNEKRLNVSSTDVTVKNKSMLRSSVGFDWKTDCFICSKQAITDIRHKGRNDVHDVGRSKFVQMRFKNVTREMMNLHVLYMEDCKITLIQQQKKQFIT